MEVTDADEQTEQFSPVNITQFLNYSLSYLINRNFTVFHARQQNFKSTRTCLHALLPPPNASQ